MARTPATIKSLRLYFEGLHPRQHIPISTGIIQNPSFWKDFFIEDLVARQSNPRLALLFEQALLIDLPEGSEQNHAMFFEKLIGEPLKFLSKNNSMVNLRIDRNVADHSGRTLGHKRPDFMVWLGKDLVMKGEEKKKEGDFNIAQSELTSKCAQAQAKRIKFLFAYAAARRKLQ